jgi:hypothetical protein
MAAALRETEITAEEARELGQIMADEAARAPRGPRVRFVNMVEIRQRVTLPGLPMLNPLTGEPEADRRGFPRYRVAQFEPHRIGTDEHGNPKMMGVYTPRDDDEERELLRLCAAGLIRARPESPTLRSALAEIEAERTGQMAR